MGNLKTEDKLRAALLRTDTGEDSYCLCFHCGYYSLSKGELRKHMVKNHTFKTGDEVTQMYEEVGGDGDRSWKQYFAWPIDYQIKEEISFDCPFCSYRSSRKRDMSRHRRVHTGEKPYKCHICSYGFSRKEYLKNHYMKVHLDFQSFQCHICGYWSVLKEHVTRHMKVHKGEKPLECTVCSSRFSRKSRLIQHMKSHAKGRLFGCQLCNYRSSRKSRLIRHIKMIHTRNNVFAVT